MAPWVFWKNRFFVIFPGIFPESWISAQKRDTRAILLKTALVRVSCIQNIQIRGETTAKVFGKVDTFWTYHASCPIILGRPFLRTVGAIIDMKQGTIRYQFPLKKGMEHFPRKRKKLPFDSIIRINYDLDASSLENT
jgi:hypothetical protein